MNKKNLITFVVFSLLLYNVGAQNHPSFYPFKGFHVGITGQAEFIQKCSFVALTGSDPAPKPLWTTGWEAGIEFSYHFAKYFGITLGINYGKAFSYNSADYLSTVPDGKGGWKEINAYDSFHSDIPFLDTHENELMFPVKLEFHYPLHKNLFFTAETGVKIKGIFQRLAYGKNEIGRYNGGSSFINEPQYTSNNKPEQIMYYDQQGIRNMGKISCNLLLGLGLYYKLPYGDLLRFSAGVNISFNNIIEGYYQYFLTESYGTFAVKNDFIYTQLSYIHTLNFQKAKKHVKKQDFSFSSKKERRKKIFDLLDSW